MCVYPSLHIYVYIQQLMNNLPGRLPIQVFGTLCMIVKGGVCTTGCDERELCGGVCTPRIILEHARGDDSGGEVQRSLMRRGTCC